MAANIFIGVDVKKGIVDQPATIAATTQSKDVEINILTAHAATRMQVVIALEEIKLAVEHTPNWPPV